MVFKIRNNISKIAISAMMAFFLGGPNANAATTLVSIEGYSNADFSNEQKPLIFAGFTKGCTGDGTATCDSCSGQAPSSPASKLFSCNKKNAYSNLRITVVTRTTGTELNISNAYVRIGDNSFTPSTAPVLSNDGTLTTIITWGELCTALSLGSDCSGGNFSTTVSVGFQTGSGDSGSRDGITFQALGRVAPNDGSDWFYEDCNTAGASGNVGFCHFEAYPGDEKIYADNLVVAPGYPAGPAAGIEYTNVVFFYEQQLAGESNAQTVARISNASGSFVVGVNRAASPPVADNRIEGLINNETYCLVMANQDASGIISYFTPVPGTPGTPVTDAELCATPSEVIGLLDDKHCFIATAAFGSQMASEVDTFRAFRNEYLLSHDLGTRFVKAYYQFGPPVAEFISQSEGLRAMARGVLWPLLILVQLILRFGFASVFLGLVGCFGAFVVGRRQVKKKGSRRE
ncbi:hypothetical protein BDW_01710 [Bdellovibrio bacteriovorus W]|nr:hypothetical protein BDW_01710 [Bdellovibrio bacteriovorus W]